MANAETRVSIKPNLKIVEPSLFKVLYMNDNITTMEFVVTSLVDHFNHDDDSAIDLAHSIHDQGSATVAVLPYEIAEQKGIEVTLEARANGFPLQVKIEATD
jgi:ATP-dependent Clp protease adaptor protein ClpS